MHPLMAEGRRRRRRRLSPPSTRRRPRGGVIAGCRPWWLLVAALASLLLLPGLAHAQGLRSATAAVSLAATRLPDGTRRIRDLSWAIGTLSVADTAILVREGAPGADTLYVRDAWNRLVLVDSKGVRVVGPTLELRAVSAGDTPGPWPVVLRVRSADRFEERRHLLRPVQLR